MLGIRKLQESTNGSFLLTIPKDLIESIGIKKGDYISITKNDDDTIILKKVDE